MTLVRIGARKLYYGFPVCLLAYDLPAADAPDHQADDANGLWSVTPCSSSYTLGDTLCFGLDETTVAAGAIERTGRCTLSPATPELVESVLHLGSSHGPSKLADSGLRVDQLPDGLGRYPVGARLVFGLRIDRVERVDGYVHFRAAILARFVEESIVEDDGVRPQDVLPVAFAGDPHHRVLAAGPTVIADVR